MAYWSIIPSGSGIDYTVEARSKEDAFNILAQRIASTGDVRTAEEIDDFMLLLDREGHSHREAQDIVDGKFFEADNGLYLDIQDIRVRRIHRRGSRGNDDPESLGWDLALFLSGSAWHSFVTRYGDFGEGVDDCIRMMRSPSDRRTVVEFLDSIVLEEFLSESERKEGRRLIERICSAPMSKSQRAGSRGSRR